MTLELVAGVAAGVAALMVTERLLRRPVVVCGRCGLAACTCHQLEDELRDLAHDWLQEDHETALCGEILLDVLKEHRG